MTTRTVTADVARFVAHFGLADLPEAAVRTVKQGFVDCIGVALAGATQPAGRIAAEFARGQGTGDATVWGAGFSAPPTVAALANGTSAHALDYDDVNWAMLGHPSVSLVPVALACGEAISATGPRLMEAYACGFEVVAKLGRTCMPYMSYDAGWHATGVLGALGAVAAASKMFALDEQTTAYALGIAVSHASGVVRNFGTMTKPLHAGLAAQAGVQAASLASAGFTADPEALEGKHGFYACFTRGYQANLDVLGELGEVFELERTGLVIKPYPCGVAGHPAIDAALALRERLTATEIDSIEHVDIGVTTYTLDKMRYAWPANELQAKFSVPYQTACALLKGQPTLADFSESAIAQGTDIKRLAERIELHVDDQIEAAWRRSGGSRPCRVIVRLGDGHEVEELVDVSKGNPQRPLTLQEHRVKFRDAASRALAANAVEELLRTLENIESLDDARKLGALVAGRP